MKISLSTLARILMCLAFCAMATPSIAETTASQETHASAKVKHKKHKTHKRHTKKTKAKTKAKKSRSAVSEDVRTAQTYLIQLGFYEGPADGLLGPKTRAAVKEFEKSKQLPITGKLSGRTMEAMVTAVNEMRAASEARFAERPVLEVAGPLEPNPEAGNRTIPSRFAQLELVENAGAGTVRGYTLTLNGQPILSADNQPSVLKVSEAYQLASEDIIIISAFQDDRVCPYKNYLFSLRSDNTFVGPIEIANCGNAHTADASGSSLFITYGQGMGPEWTATGDIWRYENSRVEKL